MGARAIPLVLIYVLGWTGENTDNWAHTGGLITGAVLALMLDPPRLQRRRGWTLATLGITWTGIAAVLLTFFVAGPHLVQTFDVDEHPTRAQVLKALKPRKQPHRELAWTAPGTWGRSSIHGRSAFVSRSGVDSSWSVQSIKRDRPAVLTDEVDTWLDDLRQQWKGQLTVVSREPYTVDGHAGELVAVRLDNAEQTVVEATHATRGNYVLRAMWTTEQSLAGRMQPVRDTLRGEITWGEPEALHRARVASERAPKNRTLRRKLADELLANGNVEEALDIYRALARDEAGVAASWVGLLRVSRWYPEAVADDAETWDAALEAGELPEVVAEVARTMDSAGKHDLARGLLERAWADLPGDRYLRRARKGLGMPTALIGTTPAHLYYNPVDGSVLDEPRDLGDGPLDVASATATGELLAAAQGFLYARIEADPGPACLGPLLLYKRGYLGEADGIGDLLRGVVVDLRTIRSGRDVPWADERLVRWVRERPDGWIERLEEAARLPDDAGGQDTSAEQALSAVGLVLQEDDTGASFRLTAPSTTP